MHSIESFLFTPPACPSGVYVKVKLPPFHPVLSPVVYLCPLHCLAATFIHKANQNIEYPHNIEWTTVVCCIAMHVHPGDAKCTVLVFLCASLSNGLTERHSCAYMNTLEGNWVNLLQWWCGTHKSFFFNVCSFMMRFCSHFGKSLIVVSPTRWKLRSRLQRSRHGLAQKKFGWSTRMVSP